MIFVCVMLLASAFDLRAQNPPAAIAPAARTYLQEALNVFEKNSARKRTVDWTAFQQRVFKAAGGQVREDTYEVIRFALRELGERRGTLEFTKELRDREALRKSQPNRSGFERAVTLPAVVKGPEGYVHRIGGRTVARLLVPAYDEPTNNSIAAERATQLQKTIEELV